MSQPLPLDAPELWTVDDVAHRLQVGLDRAYALMHQAGAIRLGRSLRVLPEDVRELLRQARETSS